MSINAISEIAHVSKSSMTATERAKLTQDEFMKILIAELSNQDPLSPMDTKEFLSQISTLHNIESVATLTDSISSLSQFSELTAASALIGKTIKGTDDNGSFITGTVDRVLFDGKTAKLVVNDQFIALANVNEVSLAGQNSQT